MSKPAIAPGHVDLWYTHIDRTDTPGLRARYRELLHDEERERAARLKIARVRDEHLVTRALVRHVLSHYADVPPGAWSFMQNDHGKPIVSAPWSGFAAFNLSHSAGMIVTAVAAEGQIGIDVENLQRRTTGIDLARRFFSAEEVSLLLARPPEHRHETFLQIWTLKEAYIKAIGQGLSFPLDRFAMSLPADGPPRIAFAPKENHSPWKTSNDWRFAQIRFRENLHLSLAVSLPGPQELLVTAREVVPLTDETGPPILCHRANQWFARQV